MRREVDHILVGSRWKLLQNCRVFRSAGISVKALDHRLLVAQLKIRIKSRRLAPSSRGLDVARLTDKDVSEVYARQLGDALAGLDMPETPEGKWESFKTTVLSTARECIGFRKPAGRGMLSSGTADLIERGRRARLDGKSVLARQLRREAAHAMRQDKERHVRGICEQVESHLWSSDSRPAYRGICLSSLL